MAAPVDAFDETPRFPDVLAYGATGGSVMPTRFIEMPSGREQRIKLWGARRRRWTITLIPQQGADLETLIDFWHGRDGGARGFRFKDWNEYTVTDETQTATGTPTFQLQKRYVSGAITRTQDLYKPVTGTTVVKKNGSTFGGWTVATTTGLVTLPAVNSKSITGITQATSAVVTVGAAHGFAVNDIVYFASVGGMTQVNGQVATVTAVGASTITLGGFNTLAYSAYTSGGTVTKYLATTDVVTATLEWDWPVRFSMQQQSLQANHPFAREWGSIELVELTG